MRRIFFNGNVYLERESFAEAVLVEDGMIVSVGGNEEILAMANDNTEMTDLGGRTMIPGFNDSHLHLEHVGFGLTSLNLYGVTSVEEIISLSRQYIADNNIPAGETVTGNSWNQDYFTGEKRLLTRHDLDKISTEHPLLFPRVCGHMATVNTKALEVLGIDENTPEVEGGGIERDENGYPNGIFSENALDLVNGLSAEPTIEQRMEMITAAMRYANRFGITSVQTNDVRNENANDVLEAYRRMEENGELSLRFYQQCCFTDHDGLVNFLEAGHRTGNGSPMNKIGPVKLFVDGSLGARTAMSREGYADEPGNYGIECFTQEQMDRMVETANSYGMQVATHAIGDGGIERVLNSYERVIENGENPRRHAIIHCQITDRPLLERFRDLDVLAQVQPIFLHYDMHIVEDRVGKELAETSYAFGTMNELGINISMGTDSPVEDLQTMNNVHCVVNRQDLTMYPAGGWVPQERIDVYTAIDNYTIGSAYASFDENVKGRIKAGYYADFAILEENIFTVPTENIKDIQVHMTVLGGKTVYTNA